MPTPRASTARHSAGSWAVVQRVRRQRRVPTGNCRAQRFRPASEHLTSKNIAGVTRKIAYLLNSGLSLPDNPRGASRFEFGCLDLGFAGRKARCSTGGSGGVWYSLMGPRRTLVRRIAAPEEDVRRLTQIGRA